jgi:hypothetical protein
VVGRSPALTEGMLLLPFPVLARLLDVPVEDTFAVGQVVLKYWAFSYEPIIDFRNS